MDLFENKVLKKEDDMTQPKKLIRIGVGIVVIVIILVVLLSIGGGPKRAIIGRWRGIQGPDVADTVEFFKDGTMSIVEKGIPMGGEYKFIDDNHLKTVVGPVTIVFEVSISKNELTMVDPKGTVYKYRRIK